MFSPIQILICHQEFFNNALMLICLNVRLNCYSIEQSRYLLETMLNERWESINSDNACGIQMSYYSNRVVSNKTVYTLDLWQFIILLRTQWRLHLHSTETLIIKEKCDHTIRRCHDGWINIVHRITIMCYVVCQKIETGIMTKRCLNCEILQWNFFFLSSLQ